MKEHFGWSSCDKEDIVYCTIEMARSLFMVLNIDKTCEASQVDLKR